MSEFVAMLVLAGFLIWLWSSLYKIKEGERGVVLRLGRMLSEPKLPGLRLAYWPVEMMFRVPVEPQTLTIASQELVAKGDAEIKAGATCRFQVVDAGRALAQVENYLYALDSLAKQVMQQVAGQFSVEEMMYAPEAMSQQVRRSLEVVAREWGIEILSFELLCDGL
ncbi:MAG TPA: SPFH domain-containing protein [Candidatus Acidoferrales bacterium]|nr:SPFH domain-containing protein [Candidatus Acidoferrales bacterium]